MQVHLYCQCYTSSLPLSSTLFSYHNRTRPLTTSLSFNTNLNLTCRHITSFSSSPDPNFDAFNVEDDDVDNRNDDVNFSENVVVDDDDDGVEIEMEKTGKNQRRIRAKISVKATLENVWGVLTDYERLADFIPGLAVSELIDKKPNFARLLQIGEQDLAFGLKFNAKGIVDCYEKDLEDLPIGQRRDIDFKMVEGDFKTFEGKWSIEQSNAGNVNEGDSVEGQAFHTTLFYVVDVEPKLWLPVRLVEGRLCKEIKLNLQSVRDEAQKMVY